jgi:hypothetical protein
MIICLHVLCQVPRPMGKGPMVAGHLGHVRIWSELNHSQLHAVRSVLQQPLSLIQVSLHIAWEGVTRRYVARSAHSPS